ncbi:MAG: hypothetical protein AB7F74_23350 [Parvibaculaceae bacterium]
MPTGLVRAPRTVGAEQSIMDVFAREATAAGLGVVPAASAEFRISPAFAPERRNGAPAGQL